jgi:hypothetical protein
MEQMKRAGHDMTFRVDNNARNGHARHYEILDLVEPADRFDTHQRRLKLANQLLNSSPFSRGWGFLCGNRVRQQEQAAHAEERCRPILVLHGA